MEEKIFLDQAGAKRIVDKLLNKIDSATENMATQQDVADAVADLASAEGVIAAITAATADLATKESVEEAVSQISTDLVGVYHFKGSVNSVADLQNLNAVQNGDVYNIIATNMNVAAIVDDAGNIEWDPLGSTFDASGYVRYEDLEEIDEATIDSWFMDKVEIVDVANLNNAIANMGENDMLVLPANSIVDTDVVIDKDAYIDANGATFTGNIAVAADAKVVIANAIFDKAINV